MFYQPGVTDHELQRDPYKVSPSVLIQTSEKVSMQD